MDPVEAYRERADRHRRGIAALERRERRLSWARLGTFVAGLASAWLPFALNPGWGWLVLVPFGAFAILVVRHGKLVERMRRTRDAEAFCEDGEARAAQRLPETVVDGERYADPEHPYAVDLDLFGPASTFARLCRARSGLGQRALADWLLSPASTGEIERRQAAVRELAPRLDWRETLAIEAGELQEGTHPETIRAWIDRPPEPVAAGRRAAAFGLSALSLLALTAWGFGWTTGLPFLGAIVLQSIAGRALGRGIEARLQAADEPARELGRIGGMLRVFETSHFEAPWLVERTTALGGTDGAPSRAVARLERTYERWEMRRNPLFAPIAALLFWGTHHAAALESWRAEHADDVRRWLDAVGELEALASLAGAAHDVPDDVEPVCVPHPAPFLRAAGLAHPSLPAEIAVRNAVSLGSAPVGAVGAVPVDGAPGADGPLAAEAARLWILSGSNMSGKSTLLRAIGTNVVLAQAGARVRARALALSAPLHVGATIRVVDSLEDGVSLFYAEIRKLKSVVDRAHDPDGGLLFLFDEILHGTNSAERQRGAAAVLKHLIESDAVGGRAIGLVTTHDLALASLAEAIDPPGTARNLHLSEAHRAGGADAPPTGLTFDYRLKDGPVTRGSALELMRGIGLPV